MTRGGPAGAQARSMRARGPVCGRDRGHAVRLREAGGTGARTWRRRHPCHAVQDGRPRAWPPGLLARSPADRALPRRQRRDAPSDPTVAAPASAGSQARQSCWSPPPPGRGDAACGRRPDGGPPGHLAAGPRPRAVPAAAPRGRPMACRYPGRGAQGRRRPPAPAAYVRGADSRRDRPGCPVAPRRRRSRSPSRPCRRMWSSPRTVRRDRQTRLTAGPG